MSHTKYVVDPKQEALLKSQHESVQDKIEALPESQRNHVRGLQAKVDEELERNNEEYFSDGMFRADAMLKKFGLLGTDRDDFAYAINRTTPGNTFVFRNKCFYRAHNGNVLMAQDYIRGLELKVTELYEKTLSTQPSEGIISKIVNKVRKSRRNKNGQKKK